MSWKLTTKEPWVNLEHGGRAEVLCTFTDGYGKLHIIMDDSQLMLIRDDGLSLRHWPIEVIIAVAEVLIAVAKYLPAQKDPDALAGVRDPDNPCDSFEPIGDDQLAIDRDCRGDGHYLCEKCSFYIPKK
jgi:hypothetical protein